MIIVKIFYQLKDGVKISVTISIGGTMYEKGRSIEYLVSKADFNMSQSKKDERNKVTIG